MKNNNPYSKFRYDNNLSVKVRGDGKVADVFGASMRPPSDNIGTKLYDTPSPQYGITTVENHIYKVERINNIDNSILPASYKGPTFFRLFKL